MRDVQVAYSKKIGTQESSVRMTFFPPERFGRLFLFYRRGLSPRLIEKWYTSNFR